MIGQVHSTLQKSEMLMIDQMGATCTEAELGRHLVTLKGSQEELREVEKLISTQLPELATISADLNVFERLFLDDHLKNLKTRVSRTQRFIENRYGEVEHKVKFFREFQEKISVLQKEVDDLQLKELLLTQEINQDAEQAFRTLKDRLSGVQRGVLQMLKLKEVFEFMGLEWDHSRLDQLQSQVHEKEKELEEQMKQMDEFVTARDTYQESLDKMRAVDLHIGKRAEALLNAPGASPESCLLQAQILDQRLEKTKCSYDGLMKQLTESEAFDDSFKEKEIAHIMQKAEEKDNLRKLLQNMISRFQPKDMDEKSLQDRLERSLHLLNQVECQLQQPLLIHLDVAHIQNEKIGRAHV